MLSRNAVLAAFAALCAVATVGGAQQTTPAKKSAAAAQSATAPKITADSAKAIALAAVPNATVTREHLGSASGRSAYRLTLNVKGRSKPVYASVDAETGQFMRVAGHLRRSAKAAAMKDAKKPSGR